VVRAAAAGLRRALGCAACSRLDFAKPLVDLFGELIGFCMGLFELRVFSPQGLGRGRLLRAHRDRIAGDVAQPVAVPNRENR
jgi:hypothetical protein